MHARRSADVRDDVSTTAGHQLRGLRWRPARRRPAHLRHPRGARACATGSSGSACTSPTRSSCARCSASSTCTTSPSKTRSVGAPAAKARAVRRLAVRRPADGAAPAGRHRPRVRRDARLRRRPLRRVGAARLAQIARRPARALRGGPAAPQQGTGVRPLRAHGLHRRSVPPDRRGARGAARGARGRDLRRAASTARRPRASIGSSATCSPSSARCRRSSTSATG